MAQPKANKVTTYFNSVTPGMIKSILKDISEGAPKRHAAEANGLSERHFYYLIQQGIIDLECGKPETLQASLVRSLRSIEMKEIKWCRANVKSSEKGHKGAEWTLEHAYQRDFSANLALKEISDEIEELKNMIKNGGKDNAEKEMDSGSSK